MASLTAEPLIHVLLGSFCYVHSPRPVIPFLYSFFLKKSECAASGESQLYFHHMADRRTLKQDTTVHACISYLIGGMHLNFHNHRGNYVLGAHLQKCESLQFSLLDVFVFTWQEAEQAEGGTWIFLTWAITTSVFQSSPSQLLCFSIFEAEMIILSTLWKYVYKERFGRKETVFY